jgi:RNA polymerase sigma factor for flagellar operon FliA
MPLTAAIPRPTRPIVLAEIWRRYKGTGDREARDQLILAYSPIVKYVAGRIGARMPGHIDIADLVSYGLGGLIDAVERFEPARGVKFESYAGLRIRGAIFDELRLFDWVPRAVRDEARKIDQATIDLSTRLQRLPTDAELAAKLSMDPAQLDASLQRVADAQMIALDEPWGPTGGIQPTRMDTLPDEDAIDPLASAVARDLREHIAKAIEHLPERERAVLALRYQEELSFPEIGEILGVSESRICQLHTKAVIQMRALLPDDLAPAIG